MENDNEQNLIYFCEMTYIPVLSANIELYRKIGKGLPSYALPNSWLGFYYRGASDPELVHCLNAPFENSVLFFTFSLSVYVVCPLSRLESRSLYKFHALL